MSYLDNRVYDNGLTVLDTEAATTPEAALDAADQAAAAFSYPD